MDSWKTKTADQRRSGVRGRTLRGAGIVETARDTRRAGGTQNIDGMCVSLDLPGRLRRQRRRMGDKSADRTEGAVNVRRFGRCRRQGCVERSLVADLRQPTGRGRHHLRRDNRREYQLQGKEIRYGNACRPSRPKTESPPRGHACPLLWEQYIPDSRDASKSSARCLIRMRQKHSYRTRPLSHRGPNSTRIVPP